VALEDRSRLRGLIQTGFAFTGEEPIGFDPRKTFFSMGENDRIDPITTAHATPVERSNLEYSFCQHKSTAPMASIDLSVLGGNNITHEKTPPFR
jgi:hypothetical protein